MAHSQGRINGSSRSLCYLIILMLLISVSVAFAEEVEETEEQKIRRLSQDSYDRVVTILGRDYYFYAQNNPVFLKTRVQDNYTVGGSACSSCAVSNAIINTIDIDNISKIKDLTFKPIRIDTHCIQSNKGLKTDLKFVIEEDKDIIQFLPMCLLNIVTSNNTAGFSEHRTTAYYKKLLKTLNLEYQQTRDINECIALLQTHDVMIVSCTGGKASPIAQRTGHYLTMADADDEYVYFLDSNVKTEYPLDKHKIIEVIEPGVIRCRISNIKKMYLTGTKFVVTRQAHTYTNIPLANSGS